MDSRHPFFDDIAHADRVEEQEQPLDTHRDGSAERLGQREVAEFLARSESHGTTDPVERHDAADCSLFLVGDLCYKLRRDMPLEQRHRHSSDKRYELVLEEFKLGRSYAPDLYLGLAPIRSRDGQLYLDRTCIDDGSGQFAAGRCSKRDPIVDWLIIMRRYDASKSLDNIVEIYRPNFTECNQLACLISTRVDEETNPPVSARDGWEQHLSEMLASFSPVVRNFDRQAKQSTMRACLSRARYRLDHLHDLIDERGKRGLIGEIHGNVGLDNVVQTPQGLQLVNPALHHNGPDVQAWIGDPVYDLASLLAELWARGLNRQANWVFSHYCNRLLDSHSLDGLQAMDLYLFVSAFEKARQLTKGLEAADLDKSAQSDNVSIANRLKGYAQTARDSLVQDEAKLIVVGGSTQANRSHLARLLAPIVGRMPGAVYMSAYQEVQALYDVRHEADLPQTAHRRSVWRLVYRRLADKARLALQAGYSVILSGAFDSPTSRENLTILQQQIGEKIPLQAFHLFDPLADMKESADGEKIQPYIQDLEYRSRQISGDMNRTATNDRHEAPILGSDGESLDWTNWFELDASRSVGSLVDQVLAQLNPLWVPMAKGTLH